MPEITPTNTPRDGQATRAASAAKRCSKAELIRLNQAVINDTAVPWATLIRRGFTGPNIPRSLRQKVTYSLTDFCVTLIYKLSETQRRGEYRVFASKTNPCYLLGNDYQLLSRMEVSTAYE